MTYATLLKSLQAGDIIVSPVSAREARLAPAGAGGLGAATGGAGKRQRTNKLLRAAVAAKARRRTRI